VTALLEAASYNYLYSTSCKQKVSMKKTSFIKLVALALLIVLTTACQEEVTPTDKPNDGVDNQLGQG
jgi:hypothetical protein